jgi:hypothetical protein
MSKLDTQEFVSYEVPEGAHVLSVYLQTHSAESETVLRNQLKDIGRRFESEDEQAELDQCVRRIWDFLAKFEARAPMLVLFCTATGSMWVRQIDVVLPNAVRWEEYPFWEPLVEAIDEFEPYGVLLLNGNKARLFEVFLGKIHECRSVERGAAEDGSAYLKNVVQKVEELIRTECPRRMVLAGERNTWVEFLRICPAYLRKSIIAMKNMSIDASAQHVMETTLELDELAERRFEIRQVDDLVGLAAAHKKVTLGLRDTLDVLNDGRIWRLVYSEDFAARGGHCLICDSLFDSDIETCKRCNVAVRPEDDLLAAIVTRALNSDASIEEVRGEAAARLDEVGGIGAFLRY